MHFGVGSGLRRNPRRVVEALPTPRPWGRGTRSISRAAPLRMLPSAAEQSLERARCESPACVGAGEFVRVLAYDHRDGRPCPSPWCMNTVGRVLPDARPLPRSANRMPEQMCLVRWVEATRARPQSRMASWPTSGVPLGAEEAVGHEELPYSVSLTVVNPPGDLNHQPRQRKVAGVGNQLLKPRAFTASGSVALAASCCLVDVVGATERTVFGSQHGHHGSRQPARGGGFRMLAAEQREPERRADHHRQQSRSHQACRACA